MPNMWYISSDRTIVTIAIYYIVLRTIPLAIITMIEGSSVKFLTIRERRWFESISTSSEFIPNTNPGRPDQRSPLVPLRSIFCGFTQRHTIRDNQLLGLSGLPYPWAHAWLPSYPYYHLECALLQNRAQPELSYLASRSEQVIWPAKW